MRLTVRLGLAASAWLTLAVGAFAEDLTVTTYYPSPRGVYEELRTSGDVKIGDSSSTTPQGRLEVRGSTAASAARALYVGNLGGTARLVVEDGGNVGIGTASPSVTLHVMGGIKADAGQVQVGNFSADPVSALGNGAIYYNTTTNAFRAFRSGSWTDLAHTVVMLPSPALLIEWGTDGTGGFVDVSIAAITGADTAKFAILQAEVWSPDMAAFAQFRPKGSGATAGLPEIRIVADTPVGGDARVSGMVIVGVDASEIFQWNHYNGAGSGGGASVHLVGYIR